MRDQQLGFRLTAEINRSCVQMIGWSIKNVEYLVMDNMCTVKFDFHSVSYLINDGKGSEYMESDLNNH